MKDVPVSASKGLARLYGRPLARMNGVGNAIVVLDLRGSDLVVDGAEARAIAATPGLLFDQLMTIHDPPDADADAAIAIYNTDGSLSGACGNGTRCVAAYLARTADRDHLRLVSRAGTLECHRVGAWRFAVDMGRPTFDPALIPAHTGASGAVTLGAAVDIAFRRPVAVGMGNPHAVFFVDDVDAVDLARVGPPIEHDPAFPERANVSFAQILDRRRIRLRVWERGAGATLGCGTGACATLVAAASTGRSEREATVELPGGPLAIRWQGNDHVLMTGAVELEWDGTLVPDRQLTEPA